MKMSEVKEIPNEYQLRDRMLHFMERNHLTTLNILKEWNEKLQRGVPIDPSARYELFGRHLEQAVKAEHVTSFLGRFETKRIYLDVLINEEEPFQFIFAYCCDYGTFSNSKTDIFLIGDEQALLERYKELEVD